MLKRSFLGSFIYPSPLEGYPQTQLLFFRIGGALLGACAFFLITNLGVWLFGNYDHNLEGFLLCYTLAIPFFAYSLISTFMFSGIIEIVCKLKLLRISNAG